MFVSRHNFCGLIVPVLRNGILALLIAWFAMPQSSVFVAQGGMASISRLEQLLQAANFLAVDEAGELGTEALPVIRRYVRFENYRSRQIAMRCAGRIGADQGADILGAGLVDQNFNVQNAAATELAKKAYPGAANAILDRLGAGGDEIVRENLALAAGYLPGRRTIELLRGIAIGKGVLASNARMALARLNDVKSHNSLIAELRAPLPRTRYDALQKLIYVNDRSFLPLVKRLLADKAAAVPVGIVEMSRYRRVCDQAVDTLVHLSQLQISFSIGPEKIYSEQERQQIQSLAKTNP